MSLITKELWSEYFDREMPPNCTYEQFCAARDYKWSGDDRAWVAQYIQRVMKDIESADNPLAKELLEQQLNWGIRQLDEL